MIRTRLLLTACAVLAALISLLGLLGQASDGAAAAIGLPRNAIVGAFAPSSRGQLIEAARLGRERRQGDSITNLASDIAAELGRSPADAELWTQYASLLAALRRPAQQIGDALKMSYFAAPADFDLMSERLRVALVSTPMSDQMLQTLAEGDIRAILLKRPDLRERLAQIHQRAGEPGKAFLTQATAAIAPDFATRLSAQR